MKNGSGTKTAATNSVNVFELIAKLDAVGDGSQVAERLGVLVAAELNHAISFLEGIRI